MRSRNEANTYLCVVCVFDEPEVFPMTLLDAVDPLASVPLSSIIPVHCTTSMTLVVVPLTFVHIARTLERWSGEESEGGGGGREKGKVEGEESEGGGRGGEESEGGGGGREGRRKGGGGGE